MDRWAHNPQSGRLDACFPLYKPDLKRASVKRYYVFKAEEPTGKAVSGQEKPDFIVFTFLLIHVAMIISEALEIPVVGFIFQPNREIEPSMAGPQAPDTLGLHESCLSKGVS